MKTVEEKIYEALGVKYFKRFVIWIQYITLKLVKININKRFQAGTNYFISGGSVKNLKRFRFWILFNTIIHSFGLFCCIVSLAGGIALPGVLIKVLFWTFINMYCLMLQRYNSIRLEKTIQSKQNHINMIGEKKEQKTLEKELAETEILLSEISLENQNCDCIQRLSNINVADMSYSESDELMDEIDSGYPLRMVVKGKN